MKPKKVKDARLCGEPVHVRDSDNCPDLGNHDYFESDVKPTHTPTPWKLDGYQIVSREEFQLATVTQGDDWRANAAHIVKCVNSYEAMLGALKEAVENVEVYNTNPALVELFKYAIAKAEGK